MNLLKTPYQKFKTWQDQPFQYEFKSNNLNHCHNCDHDFVGNYCPYCSQKAGIDRITWESLRQHIMLLWGLDSNSMLNSIFHLLLRPGHMINDYLHGRRQVSYPPVKMLFILAVITTVLESWFMPDKHQPAHIDGVDLLNIFFEWAAAHPAWTMLLSNMLFLLPAWILFRHSPRNNRHTLPEQFFILLFINVISQTFTLIADITSLVTPNMVLPIYYIIIYRYLFGYSLWGTIWRLSIVMTCSALMIFVGVCVVLGLSKDIIGTKVKLDNVSPEDAYAQFLAMMIVLSLILLGVAAVLVGIGALIDRRHKKQ